jgi:pimeloyl-ACP methyl ester carboxylesterase
VRAGRIGVVGISLGGEVAIQAAARDRRCRAIVLEGVQGGSPADMQASEPDPATFVGARRECWAE